MEVDAFVEELKRQMEIAYKEWDNARDNQAIYKKQMEEAAAREIVANDKLLALSTAIRRYGGSL